MAIEIAEQIKTFTYYTPTPDQERTGGIPGVDPRLAQTEHFQTLVQKCLTPFEENSQRVSGKLQEDRIQVFTDGLPPHPPMSQEVPEGKTESPQQVFSREAQAVIASYCRDYCLDDGSIAPEHQRNWFNLVEITPRLIEAFTRNRSIGLVQENQALNIIAASMHIVRAPGTEVVINTGFGGSDDEFTTTRLIAAVIPAMSLATDIDQVYQERMHKIAINRAYAQERERRGGANISKPEKRAIAEAIAKTPDGKYAHISDSEDAAIRQVYAVPSERPTIRFFVADQAAIAINHTKDPVKIPPRTAENLQAIGEFVDQHFPEYGDSVEFVKDIPWTEHTAEQREVIQTLATALRNSDDPIVQEVLADLRGLGNNHGGENGAENAAVYAAIHPLVFQDRLKIPFVPFLEGVDHNPAINITIGGRTERHFCAVRNFLTSTVNAESVTDEVAQTPIHSVSLISKTAYTPTYYATEFDAPQGTNIPTQLEALKQLDQAFGKKDALDTTDITRRAILRGVIYDLEEILRVQRLAN